MSSVYLHCALILSKVLQRKGTVRNLALGSSSSSSNSSSKRAVFALCTNTLLAKDVLDEIMQRVSAETRQKIHAFRSLCIKKNENNLDSMLIFEVMLFDLLFGKKTIQGGGALKRLMLEMRPAIFAASSLVAKQKNTADIAEVWGDIVGKESAKNELVPRYVRVNTIKTTTEQVVKHFTDVDSFTLLDYAQFTQQTGARGNKVFCMDAHIADLLLLPHGTDLHEHALLKSGSIVLQDKASCFPAFVLMQEMTSLSYGGGDGVGDAIDACAAPGNKTSHLASLMLSMDGHGGNNRRTRRVFAFDIDDERTQTLRQTVARTGLSCFRPCPACLSVGLVS